MRTSVPPLPAKERTSTSRIVGPGGGFTARASMDILAGMLAYVAGIGALFAGLAVAFFVFVATPKAPPQAQSEPQSAHALLARPGAPNKPTAVAAHARRSAKERA